MEETGGTIEDYVRLNADIPILMKMLYLENITNRLNHI